VNQKGSGWKTNRFLFDLSLDSLGNRNEVGNTDLTRD
jgi:hypothetical protein